jgi:hypothetical protein
MLPWPPVCRATRCSFSPKRRIAFNQTASGGAFVGWQLGYDYRQRQFGANQIYKETQGGCETQLSRKCNAN